MNLWLITLDAHSVSGGVEKESTGQPSNTC